MNSRFSFSLLLHSSERTQTKPDDHSQSVRKIYYLVLTFMIYLYLNIEKMKTLLLYLVILFVPSVIAAQTIGAQDEKLMDDHIKKNLTSGKTVVGPAAVSKVFSGFFYIVSPGFNQPEGIGYCSDYFFNINAGVLVEYEQLTTDKDLPVLLSLVKKGFILKDETGAKPFEAALNELYPVKDSDKPVVKHMKKNNQWVFLRGKFFDDQTAVIVTTDAKGIITKIEVKLAYTGA